MKLLSFVFTLLLSSTVYAQSLDGMGLRDTQPTQAQTVEAKPQAKAPSIPQRVAPQTRPQTKVAPGVKRGRASIQRVYNKGEKPDPNEDQELIFVYMQNFKTFRMASAKTACSMRFVVLTNLNQNFNMFSARLKWPNMQTEISFNDVVPNTPTYFDYTLIGDGCYSMDVTPNIEVNRCRVRGLTQEQCASKVRWLK